MGSNQCWTVNLAAGVLWACAACQGIGYWVSTELSGGVLIMLSSAPSCGELYSQHSTLSASSASEF